MTIKEFVNKLEEAALKYKYVKYFKEGDVYEIMNEGEKQYASIVLTINNIKVNFKQVTINTNIFYIDRLLEDDSNRLDIWSTGAEAIERIINRVGAYDFEINFDLNAQYIPFTEKFQDLCAGVYANINFNMLNDVTQCQTELEED